MNVMDALCKNCGTAFRQLSGTMQICRECLRKGEDMKDIGIIELDIRNEILLEKCAELYCNIWRESPWNEDFWTAEGVIADIKKEMQRKNAVGYLALKRRGMNEVVGFTWGYEVDTSDMRIISGVHDWDAVFFTAKRMRKVFYVDDLGVDKAYRERGIARAISVCLLDKAKELGMEVVTLRTDKDAVPARILYQKLGFKELKITDAAHANRTYWIKEL